MSKSFQQTKIAERETTSSPFPPHSTPIRSTNANSSRKQPQCRVHWLSVLLLFFFFFFFSGKPTFLKKALSSSNKLLIYEVTKLISGSLKILVSCNGPYTLQVSGSSPLDFTYQLLDVEDLERGATRRVVGNPLRGKTNNTLFLSRQIRIKSFQSINQS